MNNSVFCLKCGVARQLFKDIIKDGKLVAEIILTGCPVCKVRAAIEAAKCPGCGSLDPNFIGAMGMCSHNWHTVATSSAEPETTSVAGDSGSKANCGAEKDS